MGPSSLHPTTLTGLDLGNDVSPGPLLPLLWRGTRPLALLFPLVLARPGSLLLAVLTALGAAD